MLVSLLTGRKLSAGKNTGKRLRRVGGASLLGVLLYKTVKAELSNANNQYAAKKKRRKTK